MPELLVDFITSLDGYAPARAGPAGGASKGPSTSRGSASSPRRLILMGANTYRLMSGFASRGRAGHRRARGLSKVVFSSHLEEPLTWPTPGSCAATPSRRSGR